MLGSLLGLFVVDLTFDWGYNPIWRSCCPSHCYLWPLSCFAGCFLNFPLSQSNSQLSKYVKSMKWVKYALVFVINFFTRGVRIRNLSFSFTFCWKNKLRKAYFNLQIFSIVQLCIYHGPKRESPCILWVVLDISRYDQGVPYQ